MMHSKRAVRAACAWDGAATHTCGGARLWARRCAFRAKRGSCCSIRAEGGLCCRDDDTIFAWDIVNEARCPADPSGRSLTVS
jgi:hypothetical protein